MAENQRDFKGVWIPKTVWLDGRLTVTDKFYLAIYNQCDCIEGETDRIMRQIASQSTLSAVKKKLRKMQLIMAITDYEQAKNLVLAKKGQGGKCEWCGARTFALQEHHFPVPKCKGGSETVLICPTCHYEYHAILKDEE